MTKGLAYPATFGNGFQPKPVGLSDFLDANQSFVDKAQSLNQIRDVIAPQTAKKVAPQAVKKADKVFETKTIPLDASNYDDELKSIESLLGQAEDLTQEEKALIQSAISQKRQSAFKQFGNEVNQSDLSANQKKITNIQTKELTNQPVSFGESLEQPAQKAVGLAQKFTQPIVQTVGDVAEAANIPNMLMQKAGIKAPLPLGALNPVGMIPEVYQQVTGQNPLTQASDFASKLASQVGQTEEYQDVQKNNPSASGVAGFLGNAAPYVIAPETAFGRGVGAMTTRGVRNLLPMASKPVQNFIAKAIGAGVREGIQDTPLSAASTLGNLAGGVRRNEISLPEAMQQAPSQLAINAAGDFAGAGLLRGAGDLAGKALKGQIKLPEMPQVETVRGEKASAGVLEKPTTRTSSIRELLGEKPKAEKKAGVNQYNQFINLSKQKIQELQNSDLPDKAEQIQVLNKQIYDASEQKRILLAEKLKIGETSNTAEARKQLDEILNPQGSAPLQANKSNDAPYTSDIPKREINVSELKSESVNLPQSSQQRANTPIDNQIQGSQKLKSTEPTGSLSDNQFPLNENSNLGQNTQIGKAGAAYVAIRKNGENAWQKVEGKELNQSLLDPEVQRMFEDRELFYTEEGIYDKKSGMQLASNLDDSLENTVARLNKESKARGEYSVSRLINAADDKVLQDWKAKPLGSVKQAEGKAGGQSTEQIKDVNGVEIQPGDTVRTRQAGGGMLSSGNSQVGIVERTKNSFGDDVFQIRYRDKGRNEDSFRLINQHVNEIVKKASKGSENILTKTDDAPTIRNSQTVETREPIIQENIKIKNFTESSVVNENWRRLKERYGEKKGKNIYDAALRLVNPNKNEIIEIRGNGVVVKENDKYLLKPFGNTDASSKKWTLYGNLDVTEQFKTVQTPKLGTKKVINPDGTERIARTLGDSQAVDVNELAKTATKPIDDYEKAMAEAMLKADPRSSAQTKEGLTGQEFQDVKRNLSIRPEEGGYIPRAKDSLKLKEEDSKIIDEAARVETTLKISETRAEQVKDRLKEEMVAGETLKVQVPKGEKGVLAFLAGKEIPIKINGKTISVKSAEATALLEKLRKEQAEFKEKNPDLFTSMGTSEAEDVLSIQVDNIDTRTDFDYTTRNKQVLGLEFLRNDLQSKISLAESKVLRNKISNDILTADRLRDLVSDSDRKAIFQRKKGGEARQLKEKLTPEEQARAKQFEDIQKQIEDVNKDPANILKETNKELRSELNKEIKNSNELISQILDVAKGTKNKLPEGTEAGQNLIKENLKGRGLTFGFNPLAGILGVKGISQLVSFMNNPSFFLDGVIGSIGLKRGWSEILPKFAGNNKKLSAFTQQAGDLVDSMIGTQRFIRDQFQLSKNPRVKEFIGQYEALNGKLALAKTAINTLFTKEDVSKIREIFNEFSTSEITRMLRSGDIEGVADVDLLEIIRSLNKVRKQKQDLIKNYQKELTGRDFNNLKALLAMESPEITNNPFIDGANKLALKVALFNRVSSTLLTLTDPILKSSLLQNGNPARIVEGYLRAVTDRNSKLFKAFEAGKTGTYLDDTSGLKIGNVDVFKLGTEYAQDVTLFAQAKKFEADWFKQTKEKIDIVKNFDVMTPEGAEFAMRWNKVSQMAFGVGEGYLDTMNIQSSTALKGFLSLQGENMRFQGMLNRAVRNKDFSSIIGYLGYGTLIGGSGFLTGTGSIGFLLKTALNQFEPEQREKIIDTIDQLNVANKLLKLQIGDKLRLGTLSFRDEESLVKTIETAFKQDDEGKLFLVEVAKRFPRSLEKGLKQIFNGNPIDGAVTIAKATPYISGIGTLADVLSKVQTGEPLKVWTREKGKLEEYYKSPEWQDALGTTLGAKNIKRASKLKDELAESVSGQEIIKMGKKYKIKDEDPKAKTRIEGLLNVLQEDRYQIPNAHYSKNEIMDDVLESVYKKRERQKKQKGEYSKPLTEEYIQAKTAKELIRVYSVMKPEDRIKAKRLIQSARGKSKNDSKYKEVLRGIN